MSNLFFVLAVIFWGIGALDQLIGGTRINWLCAGLCAAGIGLWLA